MGIYNFYIHTLFQVLLYLLEVAFRAYIYHLSYLIILSASRMPEKKLIGNFQADRPMDKNNVNVIGLDFIYNSNRV